MYYFRVIHKIYYYVFVELILRLVILYGLLNEQILSFIILNWKIITIKMLFGELSRSGR